MDACTASQRGVLYMDNQWGGGNPYPTGVVMRKRLGVGDWMLAMFLSAIPIVGLIMQIIWATGNGKAQKYSELQNWAVACLIFLGIGIVASIIMSLSGASLLRSLAYSFY